MALQFLIISLIQVGLISNPVIFEAVPVTIEIPVVISPDTLVVDIGEEQTNGDSSSVDNANKEPDEALDDTFGTAQIKEIFSFPKLFSAVFVIIVIVLGTRLISGILGKLSERFSNYRLIIKRVIPITRIIIWTAAIYFIIVGVFSPPIETIITVGASIGIAVGFASQDILRNIFGGIMIILDKPFQVGDKIDIGGHYGEVKEIGLRSVRLVTPDDSMVSVPNGELMNKAVSNTNSSALDCQVVSDVYMSATVDTNEMIRLGRKAAITSRFVYMNKPIVVLILNEIKQNRPYVVLRVKAYVFDIRYEFKFKSDVTQTILRELNKRNITAESK